MNKFISTITLAFIIMVFVAKPALAQSATDSGTATDSATATESAATTSGLPAVLPESGAHDVLIIFSAGLIFLIAGVTVLSGTKQVFNNLE
jgi:hypothetical protein